MMKKIIALMVLCLCFNCKKETKENVTNSNNVELIEPIAAISDEMMETAIIYEANIRQYSPEGTFDAFTRDIPQLKELGVKVIWLMPVFPISETKRKAFGDKFASDIEDLEERKKYLGSYYAVTDFTRINPEFGDITDFRELVKVAHENDIYVILDWVPNHTGWDHEWLKTNPEYYTQNSDGEVIHPEGTDWTDVADLNYDNQDMRKEMIEDMLYWVNEENVDGFRCDVAGSVPLNFWQQAIPELRAQKELFMLAEAWEPELMKDNLFDMAYGWDRHHTMNKMAKEEDPVALWNDSFEKDKARYEDNDILMTFVTNHDENSWNGTIKERLGESADVITVLSYVAPGMPLIYSGQEYNLDHRLKFFEKDSIPKAKGEMWSLLQKLGDLKQSNPALHGGKHAANYSVIDATNEDVLIIERSKGNNTVIFVGNFSDKNQKVEDVLDGNAQDYMSNESANMKIINLNPWDYRIFIK